MFSFNLLLFLPMVAAFLDQAVQKFQETAKKFDDFVENADKEE